MKVVTGRQMAELDRVAIEEYGIPSLVLMENAGKACADRIAVILDGKTGNVQESSVAVVCGKGNNGGDGMVIARHLHNRGIYVEVYLVGEEEGLSHDARVQFEILRKMDVEVRQLKDQEGIEDLRYFLEEVQLCVDALVGTGLSSPLAGHVREVVEAVNLSMAPVFAVDLPSGIDASTGRILGEAVRADYTSTFGLLKFGHVLLPGVLHSGELELHDIGIPSRAVFEADIKSEALDERVVRSMLSIRPPDFHKGDAGRVAIVGGSPGLTGAPCLAGQAALRMGAGLVTVVVPASLHGIVETKLLEVMSAGVSDGGTGTFPAGAVEETLERIAKADVVVLGPGLGQYPGAKEFVTGLVPRIRVPFLVDADALNAIGEDTEILRSADAPCVVTPHPGEMSRLTRESIEAIEASRIGSALHLAEGGQVTVVLKGARTVVATPKGDVYVNTTGNPYMASGGMGDALAGMIAALAAQGLSPVEAACAGVFLHGLSADRLVKRHPMAPVTAGDVIAHIPDALRHTVSDAAEEE